MCQLVLVLLHLTQPQFLTILISCTRYNHILLYVAQQRSPDLQCWEMRWFHRIYSVKIEYKITILFVPLPILGKIRPFLMHGMLMDYSCELYTMFTMYQEEGNYNDCIMGSNSTFIVKTKSLQT